jgi:hypothetical protein
VDHDGSTEIIVASNNYAFGGWNGITVIGDASASWAPARPVWNEFAYHITNINNDGTIPSAETPNWLSWNNFRAGGTELGPSNWLADLRPGEPKICDLVCADGTVDVYLPIENPGLIPGSAVLVRLYRSDGSAGGEWTLDLPAGEASILGPLTLRKAEWGDGVARVAVDPDRAIEECHEEDNVVELGAWPCD